MTGNGNRRAPLVVAVDLDEVLGEFVSTLAKYHNEKYGTALSVSDFFSYDFVDVWGGTREEANEKVFAFFSSPQFKDHLPPIAEALEILTAFKKRGDVDFHLVTSRQHAIQADTEKWIEQHYPGIFTDMHFGNHYSLEGTVRSKPDMCRAIGAQLLVDDSLKYALQVAHDCEIEVLLFGDYPWNQMPESVTLPPLVTRVLGWDCVRRKLESMLDVNGATGVTEERRFGSKAEAEWKNQVSSQALSTELCGIDIAMDAKEEQLAEDPATLCPDAEAVEAVISPCPETEHMSPYPEAESKAAPTETQPTPPNAQPELPPSYPETQHVASSPERDPVAAGPETEAASPGPAAEVPVISPEREVEPSGAEATLAAVEPASPKTSHRVSIEEPAKEEASPSSEGRASDKRHMLGTKKSGSFNESFRISQGSSGQSRKHRGADGPLHLASRAGVLHEVENILKATPEAVNSTGDLGFTALHIASREGYVEVVDLLVGKGADVMAKTENSWQPLHFAALAGHLDIVKLLWSKFADLEAKEDMNNSTALHLAAREGHTDVVKFLLSQKADVAAKDKINDTPLHRASACGMLECVKALVELGKASTKARNAQHQTPLWLAAQNGHVDVAKYLAGTGAATDAKDDSSYMPIHVAAGGGHIDVVRFLVEGGTSVESKGRSECTPLAEAAKCGKLDMIKYLLTCQADINARDSMKNTPLHLAAVSGHTTVLKFLLENKAEFDVVNDGNQTPLYLSAFHGNAEAVSELLIKLADPRIADSEGKKPLDVVGMSTLSTLSDAAKNNVKAELKIGEAQYPRLQQKQQELQQQQQAANRRASYPRSRASVVLQGILKPGDNKAQEKKPAPEPTASRIVRRQESSGKITSAKQIRRSASGRELPSPRHLQQSKTCVVS